MRRFIWDVVEEKLCFFTYSENELSKLEAMLKEDGVEFTTEKITLLPSEKAILEKYEKEEVVKVYVSPLAKIAKELKERWR